MPAGPPAIAIVGAGLITATYHAPGLRAAGADVRVVCDRNLARARAVAAATAIPEAVADLDAVLVRPDIAAVVIATPDHEHESNALAAAAAGKAILLQKPMAMSAEGCRRIIAAAAANGVNLQVSWMHRHFEEVVRTRALLADPRLGELYAVRIRNAVSPAGDRPWCFTPGLVAGGAVMQLGVHGIDLAQHLFGPIRTVSATTGIRRRIRPMPDGTRLEAQLEDHAFAHYGFASGVMATHEVSFSEARGTDRFLIEIYCADATLQLRGPRGRLAVWAPRLTGREDWVAEDLPDPPPGRRHHAWWLEVLAGRGRDDATAADALAGQLVAEAIYRSARQGRREAITPAPWPRAARPAADARMK